jgi:hypothetical protein
VSLASATRHTGASLAAVWPTSNHQQRKNCQINHSQQQYRIHKHQLTNLRRKHKLKLNHQLKFHQHSNYQYLDHPNQHHVNLLTRKLIQYRPQLDVG